MFYFHFLSAYTVGFVPVYFGTAYDSALEANLSYTYKFPPTIRTILLAKPHNVVDSSASSNGLDILNFINNFKIYGGLYRFNHIKSRSPNVEVSSGPNKSRICKAFT